MLEVRFDGTKYIARLSYDMKSVVQEAAFFWDPSIKKFTSHDHKAAYRLIDYAEPQTKRFILRMLDLRPRSFDSSKISWPEGLTPFPHQIEFVKWCLSRKASYIAGEAGTGKTPAAVMCMNADPGPSIVICPAFLALNWADEIRRWTTWANKPQIEIAGGRSHEFGKADIYIVPASLIGVDRIREFFFEGKKIFKWLFVDEAHYFKSEDTKRTKSVVGGKLKLGSTKTIWKGFHHICDYVVDMSGTPMPNGRPMELYPIISKHAPHSVGFMDKHRFAVKYCGAYQTEWGWDYSGASELEEFNEKICKDFMLSKKLEDCVNLPPKLPTKFIYLKDDRGPKLKESEMKLLREVSLNEILKAEANKSDRMASAVAEIGGEVFVDGAFQFLSELRKSNGLRKVPQAIKVLKELREERGPLLVFAWHKKVVRALADGLGNEPYVITGDTPMKLRHEYVKEFQSSENPKDVVANIEAAGVGLTLTKSATVVFVEPSWVPGQNEQAINRAHRISQTRSVQPIFLVWQDSLDHRILNAHQNKTENIEKGVFGE